MATKRLSVKSKDNKMRIDLKMSTKGIPDTALTKKIMNRFRTASKFRQAIGVPYALLLVGWGLFIVVVILVISALQTAIRKGFDLLIHAVAYTFTLLSYPLSWILGGK